MDDKRDLASPGRAEAVSGRFPSMLPIFLPRGNRSDAENIVSIAVTACLGKGGSCKKMSESPKTAYVNVAVAAVWRNSGAPRAVDEPALDRPVRMNEWLAAMTNEEKKDLVGRVDTQALYGTKVTVSESDGDWAEVAVHGQPGPNGRKTYPGWMPVRQLADGETMRPYEGARSVVVTVSKAWLYDPTGKSPILEVSYGTRLPLVGEAEEAYTVATPDGVQRLRKSDAALDQAVRPTGAMLVEEGLRFLGLDYLWGGMSAYGFDCSGFVHTVHKRFGITIPRDAGDQFKAGRPLKKGELQPGDLVFFAREKGKGAVHHVGFYAGAGQMLHAPQTGRSIERIDLWGSEKFAESFIGGCRFI